ncbi:MAG: hypothetical protein HYU32_07470 [candidate division NC10 bacterium]|nr:hypothetical protein [candidate division NC10 bacterium]
MSKLPTPYQEFARKYKAVWKAYDELGVASTTMAVLTWVEDILRPRKASRARRR